MPVKDGFLALHRLTATLRIADVISDFLGVLGTLDLGFELPNKPSSPLPLRERLESLRLFILWSKLEASLPLFLGDVSLFVFLRLLEDLLDRDLFFFLEALRALLRELRVFLTAFFGADLVTGFFGVVFTSIGWVFDFSSTDIFSGVEIGSPSVTRVPD